MNISDAIKELSLLEAKQDIENFKDKFGEKTYDDFIKAKDRLKNNKISTDLTFHTKYTSVEEMNELIQSLYGKEKDKQRLRQLQGTDKEIRGKYKDFGIHGGYHIYQPLDYISSMDLGVNTGWCTTGRYGHAGHPEYTPSKYDAEEHFDNYTKGGIKLYYFLNPKTMYGEWAFAVYPEVVSVNEFKGNYYIKSANFILFNSNDYEDYNTKIINIFNKSIPNVLEIYAGMVEDGMYIDNGVLLKADENIKEVKIPNSVTIIGDSAFDGCSNLTSITIPDSVTIIGSDAFCNCGELTSITIPNSVTSIRSYAFYGCSSLTSITIPDSVTSIERSAFDGCRGLTSITIPNSVTSIERGAFDGCSNLTSITIPNSVIIIGSYAFYRCRGLTSITIPNSVTIIEDYAFRGCSGLTVETDNDIAIKYCKDNNIKYRTKNQREDDELGEMFKCFTRK